MTHNMELLRRKEFFFAEAAAGMYDPTIGMVVPYYDLMHELVLYMLRRHRLRRGDVVVDVGSGTGADSIAILNAFPDVHVISIELCAPIQEIHRRKLIELDTQGLQLRDRSALICADVMKYTSESKLFKGMSQGKRIAAVVTSLAIHHLEHSEKQRFYQMMYAALSPGGCLLNADLFSYANPTMSRNALDFDMAWMKQQFTSPADARGKAIPSARRHQLLKKWIQHYHTANRLEPLEDGPGSIGQLSMIRKAGFQNVVVPYRLSLSGIVMALK